MEWVHAQMKCRMELIIVWSWEERRRVRGYVWSTSDLLMPVVSMVNV